MIEVAEHINRILNMALPPDQWRWFAASRMFVFFNLIFLLISMIRLWIFRPRIWEAWLTLPFLMAALLYYSLQLFASPFTFPPGQLGFIFANLSWGWLLFALALLVRLFAREISANDSLRDHLRKTTRRVRRLDLFRRMRP